MIFMPIRRVESFFGKRRGEVTDDHIILQFRLCVSHEVDIKKITSIIFSGENSFIIGVRIFTLHINPPSETFSIEPK